MPGVSPSRGVGLRPLRFTTPVPGGRGHGRHGLLLVALTVSWLLGCAGGGPGDGALPDVPYSAPPDVGLDVPHPDVEPRDVPVASLGPCPSGRLQVVHVETWPGGGLRLVVRTPTPDEVVAADAAGAPTPAVVGPAPPLRRRLAVVVAEPTLRPGLRAALADLPEDVDVALYRACGGVDQVVGFPATRFAVDAALVDDSAWAAPPCGGSFPDGLSPQAVAIAVAEDLGHVGGHAEPAVRVLAWVGASAPAAPPADQLPARGLTYAALPDAGSVAGLPAVVARAASDAHALGLCPGLAADETLVLTLPDGTRCELMAPASPPEEAALPCDPAVVAAGERAFPRRIDFRFTAEERAVHDQRVADRDKADFALSVRVGDAAPIAAVAHLRGQSSLDCRRKNYTVDLEGGAKRHLLPGVATDEFHLISMCLDDRYFQQVSANRLARRLGLFPLGFGLVELTLDGESHGVYLLLEKPSEALADEMGRPRVILRRRFDPDGFVPDVRLPAAAAYADPLADSYRALLALPDQREGPALLAALERHFSLDAFLRLLALHSVLHNGDWIDETFFAGDEAVIDGERTERWSVAVWDMDDIYSECHHGGRWAIDDPWGLAFCAEGDLERAILADDAVYGRFVDLLEGLLAGGLTEADVAAAFDETASELLPFFDEPAVAQAMVELLAENPAAADSAVAREDIQAHIAAALEDYRARRVELLDGVRRYRESR